MAQSHARAFLPSTAAGIEAARATPLASRPSRNRMVAMSADAGKHPPSGGGAVTEQQLAAHAVAIRHLSRRCFRDLCEIGQRLVECRRILKGNREWLRWVSVEFQWSRRTAERFIVLFENQTKLGNLPTSLPTSALYQLAKAPVEVIESVKLRVANGERLSVDEIALLKALADSHHRVTVTLRK